MIQLTRLNNAPFYLNSDLIEHIAITPDTVVALTTGQKLVVKETPDEVLNRVIHYKRRILAGMPSTIAVLPGGPPDTEERRVAATAACADDDD